MQSQVRFNRVSEEGSGEGLGSFGAEPGSTGFREGFGEGLGGSGAEPSGSTGFRRRFRRRFREALVSQVRFNRVPEKVLEALVPSQVKFNMVPEKVPEKMRLAPSRTGVQLQLLKRLTSDAPLWGQLNTSICRLPKIYSISYSRTHSVIYSTFPKRIENTMLDRILKTEQRKSFSFHALTRALVKKWQLLDYGTDY